MNLRNRVGPNTISDRRDLQTFSANINKDSLNKYHYKFI